MSVVVDLSDFRELSRVLKLAAPEINRSFNSEIKGAVDRHVADRARSKSAALAGVPESIKSRRSGLSVYVDAGKGEGKPHAGKAKAFENNGVPGAFRHPVFGHRDRWADSEAHPFLAPALAEGGDGVMNDIADAIDRAITAVIR